LENVVSDNNWVGFRLGASDYSTVTNCIAEANHSSGFLMFNVGAVPCQWYLANCIAEKNDSCGIEVRTQAGAGATQTTVGDWEGFQTFANGSYGIGVFGLSAVPVHGVRLRDCYLCADNNSGLFLDTWGGYHCIDGTFTQLAGRDPAGRGLAMAASGLDYGIEATVNNRDLSISGGVSTAATWRRWAATSSGWRARWRIPSRPSTNRRRWWGACRSSSRP
jgi:parallel beta-helix repeat protein